MEPMESMETQQMQNGAMCVRILWQNNAQKEPKWNQLREPMEPSIGSTYWLPERDFGSMVLGLHRTCERPDI